MLLFQSVYKRDRRFFALFLLWVIILSIVVFCFPPRSSFFAINSRHNPVADIVFTVFTFAGDGYCIIALAVLVAIVKKWKLAIALVTTYVVSGLLCAVLKKTFHQHRPAFFFEGDPFFHSVSWLPLAKQNTFPSGHTTSAFAAAATIALFAANKKLSLLALYIACLTAYSRVYLGQHFPKDVWLGSLLGVSTTVFCFMLYEFVLAKRHSPLHTVSSALKQ